MKNSTFLLIALLLLTSCGTTKSIAKDVPQDDFFTDSVSDNERGNASWYGGEFQGRPTASGEPYDMHGYTAAHRTLPLGTIIQVTNLENRKKVVVRVNDRGPFVEGRILDLTKAAAEELDYVKKGFAQVEIEVIRLGDAPYEITPTGVFSKQLSSEPVVTPEPEPVVTSAPEPVVTPEPILRSGSEYTFDDGKSPKGYTVQVGAFKVPQNATNYRAKMGKDFAEENFLARKDDWNFVWVGDFATTQDARNFLEELKRRDVDVMYKGKID